LFVATATLLAFGGATATAQATTYNLRPTTQLEGVESLWIPAGAGSASAALDDAVAQPIVPTGNDYVFSCGFGHVLELPLQTEKLSGQAIGWSRAWFYARTPPGRGELRVSIVSGGVERAAVVLPPGYGYAWRSLAWTPASQADVDDLRLRFKVQQGAQSECSAIRAAYFELNTTCLPQFGSFRPGNWPAGCWRPYASGSPFNELIPAAEPRVHPNSAAIVARLLGFGQLQNLTAGDADTASDWWHPTYYSQPTDPLFTLHCYEASWGTCSIERHRIRVPDKARPAGGGDAHMTVVDQAAGWEYDLYKVRSKPKGGGTLEFRWGGRTRIDGDGRASDATASRYGNLAGIIRAQELEAGAIRHGLFMVAYCDSGEFVYPALKGGRSCSSIGLSNKGAPPMGARFQLAMSESQIDALAVPPWKKTILRAMARYGMYVGDTGSGSWAIQAESGSTYTSFAYEDRLVTFARANGVPSSGGKYVFGLKDGVDWARYLRVIDPCEGNGSCQSSGGLGKTLGDELTG
jgi:hypothetical protein